jgi:hypothetical protein
MKMMMLSVLTMLFGLERVTGQEASSTKVHGYVFADYFYKLAGDSVGNGSQYSNVHKKQSAVQFRRMYLYVDHKFNETFSSQFLFEGNDKSIDGNKKHSVFVKTAFLEWKNIFPNHTLAMGLIPTPTWSGPGSQAEKTWNYRSIEKTIADFRGLASASDMGIALRGKAMGEKLGYTLMWGNGAGQSPEDNKSKKLYGNVNYKPAQGLHVELYADYEWGLFNKAKTLRNVEKNLYKAFVSYETERFTAGVEVFRQIQNHVTDSTDVKPFGISLFAHAPLIKDKLSAFARVDRYNPDTEITKSGYNETFLTLGLDYMPLKNIHVMPNLWMNSFAKKASSVAGRDADVVARMTFFYIYK